MRRTQASGISAARDGIAMRDIVVAIILVSIIPLAFFRPYLGILAWIWVSYMTPAKYAWGWGQQIPQGDLVAIPALLGLLVMAEKRQPIPLVRETVLLVLLWLWFGLSTLHVWLSPDLTYHLTNTLDSFFAISKALFMVLLATTLITDRKRLRWWYLVTVGVLGFFAIKGGIWGLVTGGEFRIYGPPHSMITDNNDFALAMNMCLPMFVYLARDESSRWIRLFLRIGLLFGVIAIILTYSRGGLLGLLTVGCVLLVQSRHKLRMTLAIVVLGIAVFALAPEQWTTRMETIPTADTKDLSARARFDAWRLGTRIALDYPIFGGGFQAYTAEAYEKYGVPTWGRVHGPHSIYYEMLAEQGFVGLFLFLALILSCLLTCWRVKRLSKRYDGLQAWKPYCDMTIASVCAYAVSGAFLGRAYFLLFYQLVAATIILSAAARSERRLAEEPPLIHFAMADNSVVPVHERLGQTSYLESENE
jgi:probable O-glycosylation ligase (exosortase A-associated)